MSLAAALIVLFAPFQLHVVRVATTLIVSLPSFEIFRHTRVAAALVVLLSPYKCYTTAAPCGVLICLALPAAPCGVLFFVSSLRVTLRICPVYDTSVTWTVTWTV